MRTRTCIVKLRRRFNNSNSIRIPSTAKFIEPSVWWTWTYIRICIRTRLEVWGVYSFGNLGCCSCRVRVWRSRGVILCQCVCVTCCSFYTYTHAYCWWTFVTYESSMRTRTCIVRFSSRYNNSNSNRIPSTAKFIEPSGPRRARPGPNIVMAVVAITSLRRQHKGLAQCIIYVCTYIYIHICIHIYVYIYIYIYISIYIYVYTYIYIYMSESRSQHCDSRGRHDQPAKETKGAGSESLHLYHICVYIGIYR